MGKNWDCQPPTPAGVLPFPRPAAKLSLSKDGAAPLSPCSFVWNSLTSASVPTFQPRLVMMGLTWLAIFSSKGRASSERGRRGRCSYRDISDMMPMARCYSVCEKKYLCGSLVDLKDQTDCLRVWDGWMASQSTVEVIYSFIAFAGDP